MSFLEQLPALVGVVVGAAGSYVAVSLGDRSRFRRDRMARWEDRRLESYTEYARTIKVTLTLLYRIAAHHGFDPNPLKLDPSDAGPLLVAAADSQDLAWEQVLFLGSPSVAEAARHWFAAVTAIRVAAFDPTTQPDAWQALLGAQRAARDAFYAAARPNTPRPL